MYQTASYISTDALLQCLQNADRPLARWYGPAMSVAGGTCDTVPAVGNQGGFGEMYCLLLK